MKRILATTLSLLAAFSLTLGQQKEKKSGNSSNPEAQVKELDRQAFDAFLRQDASWSEKNLAENYVGIGPNGAVSNKQQEIAATKAGDLKIESGTMDEQQISVYGDAAIVTWKVTVKGTYKGQDASGQYRGMSVYAKRGGQWQSVATQATRIAQQ